MPGIVSVVFSFRNESEVLRELMRRIKAVLDNEPEDYELIFVDDDYSDSSFAILEELREQNPRIKIIRMSRRFGVSECVLAGLAHAVGDAAVFMDTDLQDPPELLPQMLEHWRNGADVVHTVRMRRRGESPMKMAITRLGYRLISLGSIVKLMTAT